MISPRAKALFDQYRLLKPEQGEAVNLEYERESTVGAEEATGVPLGVTYARETIAGVSVIRCCPPSRKRECDIIYLHGGAFVLMSAQTHSRLAGHLAMACGADVVVPDYRLAPEHPFPNSIEDSVKVIKARLAKGPVALVADSSGSALATAALNLLRDTGNMLPFCLVLLCPWLDLTLASPSVVRNAKLDIMLRVENLKHFAGLYAGANALTDPAVSPLYGDCTNLPPTLVQAAQHDILYDDAVRYAEKLGRQGNVVKLEVYPEMQHCFQFFAGRITEADSAIQNISSFVIDTFSQLQYRSH